MKKIYCIIIFLLTAFLLVSCDKQSRPDRNCKISELLLNEFDFPAETIVNQISSPISGQPEESSGRTASYFDDLLYHEVSRFLSRDGAQQEFAKRLDNAFDDNDHEGPWEIPSGFSYTSSIANQFYVACGNVGTKYQCRMIGQYEEYYVFFFSYMSNAGMNITIYQELLEKIDAKMAQCLHE
jgi:hypothetical protein